MFWSATRAVRAGRRTPTRSCSRRGGSGSRCLRSRWSLLVRTASRRQVMLRAAGRVARPLAVARARRGRVLRVGGRERVRGDRQDPTAGRDADRRAAAGRDHRRRGDVPRRARRAAGTSCFAVVAVGGTVLVASASSGSGTWSLAGEVIAVVSLFLNAGWYLYGRVLRGRYAIDPFAFMLGVLAAAAVLMTPVALVRLGNAADVGRRIRVGGGDDAFRHGRARAAGVGAPLRARVGVGTLAARGAAARRRSARGSSSASHSGRSRSSARSSSSPRCWAWSAAPR